MIIYDIMFHKFMTKIRNSRFAVSMIFAINGALFGTWASRIPAISNIHDLSPAS